MESSLINKVVLITGSSRGIGAATARVAHNYGAEVILHGKEESEHLTKLSEELGCKYIYCDLADEQAVRNAVDTMVKEVERIDVLVNCAGITRPKVFLESTREEWMETFEVNVLGAVHFCKAVIPYMQKEKSGRIVNVASIRGHANTPGRATYSTSKAALISLTGVLAKEFGPDITVNAVSPGFTRTDFSKRWNEATWKQAESSLVGRVAEPDEIGEVIVFLASDAAAFITGQTISVDGGYPIAGK